MSKRAGLFVTALVRIDLDPDQTAAGAREAAAFKCQAAFALVEGLETVGILAVIKRNPGLDGGVGLAVRIDADQILHLLLAHADLQLGEFAFRARHPDDLALDFAILRFDFLRATGTAARAGGLAGAGIL